MTAFTIGLAICVTLGAMSFGLGMRSRLELRRTYDRVVGRDLAGLVALLPPELRDKDYTSFMIAPADANQLTVGLVYRTGVSFRGNPPNVGMDFDPKTGELLRVHPDGVGLGLA